MTAVAPAAIATVRLAHCRGPLHEHGDRHESLSIGEGEKGALLRCFAGCTVEDIVSAWGLAMRDLFNDDRPADNDDWTPYGPAISTYEYTDEKGAVLFGVSRTADKQFPQWRPDVTKRHGRTWGLEGVRRVPYHLSRLIEAVRAGATIHVVEGEKDVIAVEEAGRVATCNPGGAGKWRDEYAGYLSGADVMVIRDKDQAGDAHARDVLASLAGSTLANGCCCSTRR